MLFCPSSHSPITITMAFVAARSFLLLCLPIPSRSLSPSVICSHMITIKNELDVMWNGYDTYLYLSVSMIFVQPADLLSFRIWIVCVFVCMSLDRFLILSSSILCVRVRCVVYVWKQGHTYNTFNDNYIIYYLTVSLDTSVEQNRSENNYNNNAPCVHRFYYFHPHFFVSILKMCRLQCSGFLWLFIGVIVSFSFKTIKLRGFPNDAIFIYQYIC